MPKTWESIIGFHRIIAILNYDAYFIRGTEKLSAISDYTSDNTRRLTEDELGAMLLKLDYIQDELRTWRGIRGD